MNNSILTKCPACNEKLYISSLKCQKCGLELKNDFEISKYDLLDKEQLNFLETFLACEGNLKELQNRMNISYPLAKKKLFELLAALQIKERNNTEAVNMENTLICNNGHTAADIIRNRIIENGGCATYYTYDGTEHQVYAIKNGTEFATDALPVNITYSFEIFNCVSDAIKANGGKARKGMARGNRVGDVNFDEKTVSGYLAIHFFGKHYGETSVDPSFFLFGIMEWAKIIDNNRGYVEFEDWYKEELEKQCI